VLQIEHGLDMPADPDQIPVHGDGAGRQHSVQDQKAGRVRPRVASIRFVKLHKPDWTFSLRRVDAGWRLWRKA